MAAKNHIFLAHAKEDKQRVRELFGEIKARGFSPWLDEVDLSPGENWEIEIPKVIREAAVCLACLSKRSVAKKGYVQKEFRIALSTSAELPPNSIYLIPVRFDDCEIPDLQIPNLDLRLSSLHGVDLFQKDGLEKLIQAIEKIVRLDPPKPPEREPFDVFKDVNEAWCPDMIFLPPGEFLMGSPETEKKRSEHEGPQHKVIISESFSIGRYPVTFQEYDYFCEQTDREKVSDNNWGRGRRPVILVSYDDAQAYCSWLSDATGYDYCLPTEAMWEYACRAGTNTAYAFGNNITGEKAKILPWISDPTLSIFDIISDKNKHTVNVGNYSPNNWNIYDMHGNVWEWCADWYGHYGHDTLVDPQGPETGYLRVTRGGCFHDPGWRARSASRDDQHPSATGYDLGFRCARM